MSQFHLFYLTIFSVVVTGSREKRLVLHSETDISQELLKLKADFAKFKQSVQTDVANINTSVQTDVANIKTSVQTDFLNITTNVQTELHTELQVLKDELKLHKDELQVLKDELQHEHGSVYVRWGRTSCRQNGTTLIYKGYMAGKHYNQAGSGTNSVCLPEDPTWGKYQDGAQSYRAFIYGTELEETDDVVFGKHVLNEDIPCAVCQVPKVSVMFPARVDCYPGWKMEYTGYLVSHHHTQYGSDYVCLDGDPEFVTRGAADTEGHLLYLVEGVCGALVCPPYFNYRELACVVCSL